METIRMFGGRTADVYIDNVLKTISLTDVRTFKSPGPDGKLLELSFGYCSDYPGFVFLLCGDGNALPTSLNLIRLVAKSVEGHFRIAPQAQHQISKTA